MKFQSSLPSDRAAINRENSLKSTGPKTDAGKQRSSLNALRHGLTGQTIVLPSEDLAAFESFTQGLLDDLKPSGPLETQLAQTIAGLSWRINRASALENNLFTFGMWEHSASIDTENSQARDALAMAAALCAQTQALSTISLHQNRLSRTFERTLNQFRQIQAARRAEEDLQMKDAGRLYLLHAEENKTSGKTEPYHPAADGFVFTNSEIDLYLYRDHRYTKAWEAGLQYESAAK